MKPSSKASVTILTLPSLPLSVPFCLSSALSPRRLSPHAPRSLPPTVERAELWINDLPSLCLMGAGLRSLVLGGQLQEAVLRCPDLESLRASVEHVTFGGAVEDPSSAAVPRAPRLRALFISSHSRTYPATQMLSELSQGLPHYRCCTCSRAALVAADVTNRAHNSWHCMH